MTDSTSNEEIGQIDFLEPNLEGAQISIAIVQARFNEEHCHALTKSCIQ